MLKPGQPQQKVSNWSHTLTLDREKGIATPDNPSDKLKNFSVKLEPMLGCVSVAPFWKSQCGRSASPRGQGRRCRLVIRTARREEVQQNSVRDGRPRDGRRPEDDARGGGATAQQHAAGGGGRGLQRADLGRLEGFAGLPSGGCWDTVCPMVATEVLKVRVPPDTKQIVRTLAQQQQLTESACSCVWCRLCFRPPA